MGIMFQENNLATYMKSLKYIPLFSTSRKSFEVGTKIYAQNCPWWIAYGSEWETHWWNMYHSHVVSGQLMQSLKMFINYKNQNVYKYVLFLNWKYSEMNLLPMLQRISESWFRYGHSSLHILYIFLPSNYI